MVDEPPQGRRREADRQPEGRRDEAGAARTTRLGAHEQDHAEAVDADRHAREDRGAQQARDIRRPQDAGEALRGRHPGYPVLAASRP
jgi:hypothetical protein